MDVHLRAMRDADLARLADLWVASWRATLPQIDFAARRGWFIGYLDDLQDAGAKVFVAEDNSKSDRGPPPVCGFVTINAASGDIDQLAVAPDFFGMGLADILLAQARKIAPERLTLKVNQDNPRAVRFYEKNGFVKTGESVSAQSGLKVWSMEWTRG